MLKALKQAALGALKTAGVSTLVSNSRWRRRRLLILAYHGISLSDEHLWNGAQFMDAEVFRGRMRTLKGLGCNVLPLGEAVARLNANNLPERAVVITFDDGFSDFHRKAFPILQELGFPVTLYLTTFYTLYNRPVFDVMCSYLLWKGRNGGLDLGKYAGRGSRIDLRSAAARDDAQIAILSFARERKLTAEDKDALLASLATELRVDYESLLAQRILQNLTAEEVRQLAEGGVDIQLHTHRHRTPLNEVLFTREIEDNRRSIQQMTGRSTAHFCYPSGVLNPAFPPWLREAGIASATTCELGLASPGSDPLLLPRLIDVSGLSPLEFEGWVTGISSLLPRRNH